MYVNCVGIVKWCGGKQGGRGVGLQCSYSFIVDAHFAVFGRAADVHRKDGQPPK